MESTSGAECVTNSAPDIVVLDTPAWRSKSLLDRLSRMPIPVLVFSEEDETMCAEEALRAGARGYLMKSCPAEQLLTALRTILAGDLYLSEQMKSRFLKRIADGTSGS